MKLNFFVPKLFLGLCFYVLFGCEERNRVHENRRNIINQRKEKQSKKIDFFLTNQVVLKNCESTKLGADENYLQEFNNFYF